jgi:hypothetical protein
VARDPPAEVVAALAELPDVALVLLGHDGAAGNEWSPPHDAAVAAGLG